MSIPRSRPFGVVYLIHNTISHRIYIGITVQEPKKRWRWHQHYLRKGSHPNPHLQRAWTRYGASAFEFVVVEECDSTDVLNDAERFHIAYLRSVGAALYNLKDGGGFGGSPGRETRRRLSEAGKGRVVPDETRRRVSQATTGVQKTVTAKLQARWEAQRGQKQAAAVTAKRIASQVARHNPIVTLRGPDGQEFTTQNVTAFAREHTLHPRLLGFVVSGRQRHHRGWTLVSVRQPDREASVA